MEEKRKDETKATLAAAALPILENFIHKYVGKVCDIKVVDTLLRELDPLTVAASGGMPSVVGAIFEQLPHTMFGGEVVKDLIKDTAIEAARTISAKIKEKGGVENVTSTEYKDALDQGAAVAEAKRFVVIDGLLHSGKCLNIQRHLRSQRQGKDQPQQTSMDTTDVTLGEAAEIPNLKVAPCCLSRVDAELKKPAETPRTAPVAPPRSPMEIMMRGSEEQRVAFFGWYDGLDEAMKLRVIGFLKHLDSMEEFAGLIYMITKQRHLTTEMLTLLENANGSHQTAQYLRLCGQAIARGSKCAAHAVETAAVAAWAEYRVFDASLAPVVKRLEANAAAGPNRRPALQAFMEATPKPPRKRGIRGFLKALTRVI